MNFSDMKKEQKTGLILYFLLSISVVLYVFYICFIDASLLNYLSSILNDLSTTKALITCAIFYFGITRIFNIIIETISKIFYPEKEYITKYKKKKKEMLRKYPKDLAILKLDEWASENEIKEIKLLIKRYK